MFGFACSAVARSAWYCSAGNKTDPGTWIDVNDLERQALEDAGISVEQYEAARALAEQDLIDYLLENGGKLLVELFLADIKECINDPDIGTCL
ncbi:hypothetical protein ABZ424_28235 [Streptomyces sp. NPDC005790]|uniref:hypothetical protein n=1 Tax=Streptomyces sp. NPDC005790 TaxID=3154777 RepID=UPI0033D1FC76